MEKQDTGIVQKGSSVSSFWAGLFFGWIALIAAVAGLGYYWYQTRDPHLQQLVTLQANRLDEQLNRQSDAFDSLLDDLSGIQSARFEQMIHESEASLDEGFDARLVRVLESKLDGLYTYRDLQSIAMAEQALETAIALLSNGDVRGAGLYFSNAVQHDPNNWQLVRSYAVALIDWAKSSPDDVDPAVVIEVLADLENYLPSRLVYLPPDSLEDALEVLSATAAARQAIVEQIQVSSDLARQQQVLEAVSMLETLLASDVPASEEDTERQMSDLDRALAENPLSYSTTDPEYERVFQSAVKRQQQLADQLQVLNVLSEAEEHIQLSNKKSLSRETRLSHLARAESLVNQVDIALVAVPETIRTQATEVAERIQQETQAISAVYSRGLLSEIQFDGAKYRVSIPRDVKPHRYCTKMLEQLQKIYRTATIKASGITDPGTEKLALGQLELIGKAIRKWQHEQHRRYIAWSVNEIKEFHSTNKVQLEALKNTDEKLVYSELLEKLGVIDTNQLTYAASLMYSEVFGLYYKKLDTEDKIRLTGEMAEKPKMSIDVF